MEISMKVNKYWFGYFLVKLFYMFFALFIYSKLTILGDTERWIDGSIENYSLNILLSSTHMLDFFGGLSSVLFGHVFGNLPFVFLSFYGIYYSLARLSLKNKQLFLVLFLLSLPSFGIWSSIAGKEAVGVFYMGIICGYLIDILNQTRLKPKFIELLAFYLLIIFKPQYSVALVALFLFIVLYQKLQLKAYGKLFLFIIHLFIGVVVLYIFRNVINEISFIIPKHFSQNAGSTRENTIWINDYDVFYNAAYGMFIAFWGPTLEEVIKNPIKIVPFIESLVICSFFIYFLFRILVSIVVTNKINVLVLSLVFITVFWLLFVHYPFGVLNAGSALRYRENFYGFLVVFLYYIFDKKIKSKHEG
jgi:hypothetical protein